MLRMGRSCRDTKTELGKKKSRQAIVHQCYEHVFRVSMCGCLCDPLASYLEQRTCEVASEDANTPLIQRFHRIFVLD